MGQTECCEAAPTPTHLLSTNPQLKLLVIIP
jgi:hypothetical protein